MEQTYATELQDAELYDFLVNAPKKFRENERIKKFQMKNGDFIHCVLWNFHFYISGTDIVKILIYRFQMEGRQINNLKKFEEGIFSDLRNLKPGIDATLEGPRSEFLEFMYKNGCIRTQKKQKVFYWYSAPHDALFCDAMERDMRRETFFVASKPYSTGIFSNTKTNRNVIKQRASKAPLEARAPLFGGFGEDLFFKQNSGDLLSKTLFSQDDVQNANIIKKKKRSILDEIVNYSRKGRKEAYSDETGGERLLFGSEGGRSGEALSEGNGSRLSELDSLIRSADLRLKEAASEERGLNINDLLYKSDNIFRQGIQYGKERKKEEESGHVAQSGAVTFISDGDKKDLTNKEE
ncbi:STE12 [Enterospora canceri]|uniref:STE12 n=1 Tax=Enterospora canceri TaxID=1081671 RepID=A0A1Y1S819_9MICR|nr:STE12 [Enterospora canceri]